MINFNSKYQKNNIEEKIKLTLQYKKKKKKKKKKLNPIDIIIYIYVYSRIEWNKINKSWKNRVKWIKIWVFFFFFFFCWEFTKWVRKLNKYKILSLYHSVFICCFLDKDKINTPLSFHKNKGMCALSTLKRNV